MGVRNGVATLALECRLWGQALRNSGRRVQLVALGAVAAVAVPGAAAVLVVTSGSEGDSAPTAAAPVSVAELQAAPGSAGTSERTGLSAPDLRTGAAKLPDPGSAPSGKTKSEADDKPAAEPARRVRPRVVTAPVPSTPARTRPVADRSPPRDSGGTDSGKQKDDKDDDRRDGKKKTDRDEEAPIAGEDPANPDQPQAATRPADPPPPTEAPADS